MRKLSNVLQNFIPDAQGVIRRFPLATLMITCFAVLVTIEANDHNFFSDETLMRLVGGTVLAAYLSVILTLVGEGRGKPIPVITKALIVGAALLVSYFFRELAFITPMAIGAAILWLGSAPLWQQKRDDVAVWDFTHKIWTGVIFTIAGSIIYLIGAFAISAALKSLFGVNINNFVEDWMLPIGLAFLAPMAWMSMIPKTDEDDSDSLRNPGFISRAVGFLGTWILAPLTLVVALILAAYMGKIIIQQSVPNGEIAGLVTPFLIIGTLTWLILDPPFIQEKRLARWFHKFWFPLMIPAALLLAFAVFVRISNYGWTIERYLLVLASIWGLGIAIWFSVKGAERRDIRIIPGFAALLLAIGSIGPWGADGVSAISQNARLVQALNANNMLDAEGHIKPKGEYKLEDKKSAVQARSALDYLLGAKKDKRINKLLATPIDLKMKKGESKWDREKTLRKKFGLENVKVPNRYNNTDLDYDESTGNFERKYEKERDFIFVADYDYISDVKWINFENKRDFGQSYSIGKYVLKNVRNDLVITENGVEITRFEIVKWFENQPVDEMGAMLFDPHLVLYSKGDETIAIQIFNTTLLFQESKVSSANLRGYLLFKGIEIPEN